MGGCIKTSTPDVTTRAPLFPYSRSKMEIALVASQIFNGNLSKAMKILKIPMPSCLTFLASANSLICMERAG